MIIINLGIMHGLIATSHCMFFYKKHAYKKHEAEIRQELRNI